MKQWKNFLIVIVIPIFFLIIGICTLGDYGINWDEPYHYRRGQAFLQYFLTGQKTYANIPKYPALKGDSDNPNFRNAQKYFEDSQKNSSSNLNLRRSFYQDDSWDGEYFMDIERSYGHPAINDVLAAFFNKIFFQTLGTLGDLESYRLFIVITVSLATFGIAIFMWKEFGTLESLFASLAFASYPLLLGEQHFNIKDPTETAFYTLTILTAYLGIKKNRLIWLIASIFFFSIGLSTKFNIIFVIIPLLVWFIFFNFHKKINFKNIALLILIGPFIAIGVLIISDPALWRNPIFGIGQILKFYLEVGYPGTPIAGYNIFGFINTFPTIWIIYTSPPILIVLFIFSILLIKNLIKKSSFILLLFVWIVVAIGRNSLFGALSYGGVRLIMEFVPALAMLTGVTAGYIAKTVRAKTGIILSLVSILLVFAGFVPTILKIIKIHPNENVYFNVFAGGLSGAKDKNIPYWGDSYGNAYYPGILWLNKNAEMNAKVTTPVGNTSNIPRFKLRPDIALSPYYWSGLTHNGEYLVELTYNYPPENWFVLKYLNEAMIPVYEVKVDGVSIAKVWKNDPIYVRDKYRHTKDISVKIVRDKKNKTVSLIMHQPEKVMKVQINEPIKNCEPLETGYVVTSSDGTIWTREPEDIGRDQLNRQEHKDLNPIYEFYFMASYAKTIVFNVDKENSCLLLAKSATLTILEN